MAGCSRLPGGRSRLNLTQRTKHFMRSNFVKPTDVTSIKSFNIDGKPGDGGGITMSSRTSSGGGGASGGSSSTNNNLTGGGGVCNNNKNNINSNKTSNQMKSRILNQVASSQTCKSAAANNQNSRLATTSSKQLFGNGQTLSTFNGISSTISSQSDGRYHFTSDASDGHTDIRTLNTRLQKPSLQTRSIVAEPPAPPPPQVQGSGHCINGNNGKSLMAYHHHNHHQSLGSKTVKPAPNGTSACYLNLRQQQSRKSIAKQLCHMEDLNHQVTINRL